MPKTNPTGAVPLRDRLERLAAVTPTPFPFLSLYLNLAVDQNGRETHDTFLRKVFAERVKGFPQHSPQRQSFEQDRDRITAYLGDEVNRSSNGVAIFACSAENGYWDAVQVDAPFPEHALYVASVPQLYSLARLVDQYPRYAVVVLDTHRARIFVCSLAAAERTTDVTGVKTKRHAMGGWSQARYQRHTENFHLHHVKDVIDRLNKIVSAEQIQHIVVAGDEVAVPLFTEQLPIPLRERLVDFIRLDRSADEATIVEMTMEVMRQKDAETDAQRVAELTDAWRSGGLGVAGGEATLRALELGQVDELIMTASLDTLRSTKHLPVDAAPGSIQAHTSASGNGPDETRLKLSSELIRRAQQTGASIRFIEDPQLLAEIGGVGALLRFSISPAE